VKALLGGLDAETREEQERLDEDFVVTESIRKAAQQPYPFVSGRKGSGKSAVAYHLMRSVRPPGVALAVTADHYDSLHSAFLDTLLAQANLADLTPHALSNAFQAIWSYVLDLCVLQIALEIAEAAPQPRPVVIPIRRYLEALAASQRGPVALAQAQSTDIVRRVCASATAIADLSQALDTLLSRPTFTAAKECAKQIVGRAQSVIVIDTLERYDISEKKLFSFQGLVRAVKRFHDKPPFDGISVKCFLPEEMTEHLYAENIAKYKSITAYLEWGYAELLHFLGRRYCSYLKSRSSQEFKELGQALEGAISALRHKNITSNARWRQDIWRHLGPERVKNRSGVDEDAAAYVLRHTQKRPRELLCCGNFILQHGLDNLHMPHFSCESVVEGVHSQENLDILLSTSLAVFSIPYTDEAVHHVVLRMLANEARIFRAKDFRRIADRVISFSAAETAEDRRNDLRAMLLRSGLLGVVAMPPHERKQDGKKVTYYITRFEYSSPGHLGVNERSVLAMHPVLADRLAAKWDEYEPGIVYHSPEREDLESSLVALAE
jgi:hypothetical protein